MADKSETIRPKAHKICPHCHTDFGPVGKMRYGCARTVCRVCKKEFIAIDTLEPALDKANYLKAKPSRRFASVSLIVLAISGLALFVLAKAIFANAISGLWWIPVGIGALFLLILFGVGVANFIRYQFCFKRVIADWEAALDESNKRLSRGTYAQELKQAGFPVPEKYLAKGKKS